MVTLWTETPQSIASSILQSLNNLNTSTFFEGSNPTCPQEMEKPPISEGHGNEAVSTMHTEALETCAEITASTAAAAGTDKVPPPRGLKILFLSSDTGGGHRASAEALANQFQLLFPGSTYDLLDVVEKDGVPPYNSLVSYYKHLSAHPTQWKLVYSVSNSRAFEMLADAHLKLMCERAVRKSIKSYSPDVVISVHPLMTNVPVLSCSKISNETGNHLPIFTVVTDLGSAHCLWFASGVEKLFVGSDQVKDLAISRGKVPEEKIVKIGLPIRYDFAVQSENLGDRMSAAGKDYQRQVRQQLELQFVDRPVILVMGGGEGVGSLGHIVDCLYVELTAQGIDALILVVCGRNEKLRQKLATRDWLDVFKRHRAARDRHINATNSIINFGDTCVGSLTGNAGCLEAGTVTGSIRRMLSTGALGNALTTPMPDLADLGMGSKQQGVGVTSGSSEPGIDATMSEQENSVIEQVDSIDSSVELVDSTAFGKVHVVGLGFVTRMAEYMVASDVLVSKAGPGTIAEAAALSLPIMLTSYLPGQEEGNVDYVVDAGFGAFIKDSDPIAIAEEVCLWLTDHDKLSQLSCAAKARGTPYAARDIAKQIGDSTLKWIELNEANAAARATTSDDKKGKKKR